MRICVYCASSTKIAKKYLDDVSELGTILARNNYITVYGGGSVGAMGALANAVLENKGTIIGVIPQFMIDLEWGNPNISQMIIVNTMAERKQKFIENIDAVVALPGGTGTLEELAEIISLKKLGLFTKPIIILNTNNFYDLFIAFIEKMVSENFIHTMHRNIYTVIQHPNDLIKAIAEAPKWDENARDWAAL